MVQVVAIPLGTVSIKKGATTLTATLMAPSATLPPDAEGPDAATAAWERNSIGGNAGGHSLRERDVR